MRVVTILAWPASLPTTGTPTKTNDPFVDDYLALAKTLSPTGPHDHQILRVPSLRKARNALLADRNTSGPPDLVQFVGHGAAGRLALASSFGDKAPAGEVFSLTANRNEYLLADSAIGPPTSVRLLGCNVGDDVGPGHDGPVLLFALACLWDCTVEGPVTEIGAEHFDAQGVFAADWTLSSATPSDLRVTLGTTTSTSKLLVPLPPHPTPTSRTRRASGAVAAPLAPQLQLKKATGGVSRSTVVKNQVLNQDESAVLLSGDWSPVTIGHGMLPELRFAATEAGKKVTVEMLASGRVLRVGDRAFARLPEGADDIRAAPSLWDRGDPARRALLGRLARG